MSTVAEKTPGPPSEDEFIHALHNGQIFPVFQPVVDRRITLLGMELLVRWSRHGHTLLPGAFLPELRSADAWRALTLFVLGEAVRNINRFGENCYFAINIPACIATSDHLQHMVRGAVQGLNDPGRVNRLVLEIAEDTDFYQHMQAGVNLTALVHTGVRVVLDDCFSVNGAPFPPRKTPFSGYKLDMGIVRQARQDVRTRRLIKNFTRYCRQNGVSCVAEGIEMLDDFRLLSFLGADSFQGYLLSRPVSEKALASLVRKFKRE